MEYLIDLADDLYDRYIAEVDEYRKEGLWEKDDQCYYTIDI